MLRWITLIITLLLLAGITYADTITDFHPNSSAAWNQKAYSLQKSGNYTEALNGANQATQLDPNNTPGIPRHRF